MRGQYLVLTAVLILAGDPDRASAGFTVESLSVGPFGTAEVEGFERDALSEYRYTAGQDSIIITGSSGDTSNSAFYYAIMSYDIPSIGSSLTVEGNWGFSTALTDRGASIGSGIHLNASLTLSAGEQFAIEGFMFNSGISFRDPDGMEVFPYTNNYFSGTSDPVSITGTLTKSGVYQLDMTSSIFTSGSPAANANDAGAYSLMFSVNDSSLQPVPAPGSLVLLASGALPLLGWHFRRRKSPSA